ncbi:cytochrome ubiquinol oxidase subunit I [Thiotrichales bacterium 19S3-7]|nr:cytochrome ubiquinol oxidase subunit I [Thiotrichales bacterium 19S3-7]MCF6802912.1 cytochrome ubiquinol oxidase subunit I [Thiotrichales bacterium 19S3-11]
MLPQLLSVDFARWQFGLTASFHFLFVPLTLGLTWILFTMECLYVKTGKPIYKDMVRFWGKLLGINFALGVLTGLTMEFEFGTNWAYYSQFVGDAFGTPLAIEGLVAFMLESTFVGIFFFGWDKLSKKQHLIATFCLAIGSTLSALMILIANGFMQHPIGAVFNPLTMRMETTSLLDILTSTVAQIGFIHTILAGYATAAVFVVGISAFYLLHARDIAFAKRSMAVGLGFGLVVTIMLLVMGDQNGLAVYREQPAKLAAIEAEWTTQKIPANFNLIAWPNQQRQENVFELQIPDLLGPLVTHSLDTPIYGLKEIMYDGYKNADGVEQPSYQQRIINGAKAYDALMRFRKNESNRNALATFKRYQNDLGFGMILLPYVGQGASLEEAIIHNPSLLEKATRDSVPNSFSIFWGFRIMVGLGLLMLLMFVIGIFLLARNTLWQHRWILRFMLYMIPAPWIAAIAGWFVTEHGRQPWTVYYMLPTSISSSTLNTADVFTTMVLFLLFDSVLFAVEMFLMFKFARLGPSALHSGRYHFEKNQQNVKA